jgi:hypothetical protein
VYRTKAINVENEETEHVVSGRDPDAPLCPSLNTVEMDRTLDETEAYTMLIGGRVSAVTAPHCEGRSLRRCALIEMRVMVIACRAIPPNHALAHGHM